MCVPVYATTHCHTRPSCRPCASPGPGVLSISGLYVSVLYVSVLYVSGLSISGLCVSAFETRVINHQQVSAFGRLEAPYLLPTAMHRLRAGLSGA